MAALLRGRSRRGYRLLEGIPLHIRRNAPSSTLCLHDSTLNHVSATHGHEKTAASTSHLSYTGFLSSSHEATSIVNTNANNNRGFSYKSSVYKKPIIENRVLSTPCTFHVTETLQKIIPKDGVAFDGGVLVSSNATKHWSQSKRFHTRKLALITSNKSEIKTYGGILLGVGGRKILPLKGVRSFSTFDDFQNSVLDVSSITEQTEAETNELSAENVEDFDFTNFPALKSSFFENYERPSEMQVRKKRVAWQTKARSFGADKNLTVDSIPKPRGRTYDFGLGNLPIKPPPLEAGARPQGGLDVDISFNECETDTCESSLLQTQSCLPSKISETTNWSEASEDSHVVDDKDSQMTEAGDFQFAEDGDFQATEDRVMEDEQDFLWDPYNVGDEQGLPLSKTSEFLS